MKKRPSYLREIDPTQWEEWNKKIYGSFYYNTPTYSSVNKAEMRLDEVRPWPQFDMCKQCALSFVDKILEPVLSVEMWSDDKVFEQMNIEKTAAYPWRFMGYKTRKDLFQSEFWKVLRDDPKMLAEAGHVYRSIPKDEWSDIADWEDDKTRTFLVPGAHVLYWQLRCFGAGNEALKNFSWSKYGFNPFDGNVDRVAKTMMRKIDGKLVYKIRLYWDVSGYDRKIYLYTVADRRVKFFLSNLKNKSHQEFAEWVAQGLKQSVVVLSNGDIVIRVRGNNSGSGMTTPNNIEAGFEVVTDLLVYAYYMKYKELPSYELVYEQMVMLYGDDNACALMEEFDFLLDETLISGRLLNFHGLKLKLLGGGVETPLNELSFLGFTFHEYKNHWIPKWNLDRLLVPLVYSKEQRLNLPVFLQRFYSILLLSFAHDEWELIRSVYMKVLTWCHNNSGDPMVKSMVRLGVPSRSELETFYLGWEAGGGWPISNEMEAIKQHLEPLPELGSEYNFNINYKGQLQELMQKSHIAFPGIQCERVGPAHCPMFLMICNYDDRVFTATAPTKAEGEKQVCYKILKYLETIESRKLRENESALVNLQLEEQRKERKAQKKKKTLDLNVRPTADATQMFFYNFMVCYKSYIALTPEERMYHPLSNLIDLSDYEAAARLAEMFKTGGFNPYGNGQFSTELYALPWKPPGRCSLEGDDLTIDEVEYYSDLFAESEALFTRSEKRAFELSKPDEVRFLRNLPSYDQKIWLQHKYEILQAPNRYSEMRKSLQQHLLIGNVVFLPVEPVRLIINEVIVPALKFPKINQQLMIQDHRFRNTEMDACNNGFIAHFKDFIVPEFPEMTLDHLDWWNSHSQEECDFILNSPIEILKDIVMNKKPVIKFMEGGFNPYGNGQTTQFTLMKPLCMITPQGGYVCSSTCIFNEPLNVVGTGDTASEAFDDWNSQIVEHIQSWAPDSHLEIRAIIRQLKSLPLTSVPENHPMGWLFKLSEDECVTTFWDKLKVGSFNPYGNGQRGMSRTQYFAVNSRIFASLSPEAKEKKYQAYIKNYNKKNKSKPTVAPRRAKTAPPKNVPKGPRSTGLEKTEKAVFKLAPCTKTYATALRCPFWFQDRSCSEKVPKGISMENLPCIPMFPAIKTRKFFSYAKGTFGAPAGQIPFLMFAPWRLANNNSLLTNVSAPILYSLNSVGGAANQFPLADTGALWNNGASNLNTDYNLAQLLTNANGQGIRYRVVGAGIRFMYDGPQINSSGQYACIEQPDHETLSALTLDQCGQMDSFFSMSVSNKQSSKDPWTYLTYTPVDVTDFDFNPDTIANATWPQNFNKNHFIGVLIPGAPTGGDYFLWEAIVHYEAIGQQVRGKTDTPSDPTGTSIALNSIKPESQKSLNMGEKVLTSVKEGSSDMTVTSLASTFEPLVKVAKEVMPLVF